MVKYERNCCQSPKNLIQFEICIDGYKLAQMDVEHEKHKAFRTLNNIIKQGNKNHPILDE
jgi:hypothetical protein